MLSYFKKWGGFTLIMLITTFIISLNGDETVSFAGFVINILYFAIFYIILLNILKNGITSKRILFLLVVFFSVFFLTLFKMLYFNETNSFFEFSAKDSLKYDNFALDILRHNNLSDGIRAYLNAGGNVDDLGAIIFTYFAYYFYPSTIAVNIFNVIVGVITVMSLFRISKKFMSLKSAFLTAFIYGTSSFVLYLYSTGMKESVFTMLIVLFFEYLLRFYSTKKLFYLILSLCFIGATYFFRPAVMYMAVIAVMFSLLYSNRKNIISLILILPLIASLIFVISNEIQSVEEKYYAGGELMEVKAESVRGIQPTPFNYTVSFVSGMIGPLPSYHSISGRLQQSFYSIGLGLRVFLGVIFWIGLSKIFKNSNFILVAIAFFVIFEMLSLSIVLESFELRLNSPHIVFIYLISFIYIDKYLISDRKLNISRTIKFSFVLVTFLILVWNLRF